MSQIFLSHSGSQKPFVVRLKDALQAAGHSPFFDVISLPKAEPFPPNIEEALRKCKLGVVVLSEEFMMSHWPMRELTMLHHNPSAKILPLFFNLSPNDLKSQENLSRWRPKWKELGNHHSMDTSQWEKVVGSLPSLNGEVFLPGSSEASYIDKVVKEICRLVPLSPHYDVLGVNGERRLCKVIMSKFQTAQCACKSISCACTIALHGIGGAGKTTICKLMANAYSSHYPGKSLWLEFPSDGNKTSIAEECKKLLRQCTNANDEHVLSKATSLNEIFPELDKRMSEHAVFLAIDNIWESTSEEARRLLQVKFNKESKILITSRSRAVLKELLKGCDEATCIAVVPSMIREEALSTFEMSFDHDLSHVPHNLQDRVLSSCLFEDSYHPLALKALGKRLRRMQGDRIDQKETEANISHLSLSLADANIETLIRINYDNIPSIRQRMFLDVVVVFLSNAFQHRLRSRLRRYTVGNYVDIQKGLRILYAGEQHSKYDIDVLMHQLAWDGLLDFEGIDVHRRIVVHDLYLDLAKREAIASPTFFLGDGQENSRDWSMVKRVVLPWGMEEKMVEVIKQKCPQLEVLIAMGRTPFSSKGELQLDEHMGALRILILEGMFLDISTSMGRFRSAGTQAGRCRTGGGRHVDGWRGCVGRLAWLELVRCRWGHAVEAVYDMDRLEVLILDDCQGPWKNWSKLCNRCSGLEEFILSDGPFDDNINNSLRSLSKLKNLDLSWVANLNNLAVCANLQDLVVDSCSDLQEICSLGPLHDLITLSVSGCRLLKAITGLNGATQLQNIFLSECDSLEEIPGLHNLEHLINLENLYIQSCPLLKSLWEWNFGALRGLIVLNLWSFPLVGEIPGLHNLINLKELSIGDCPLLKSITCSSAGQLQELKVSHCDALEEIPDLVNLKHLSIKHCPLVRSIDDAHGQLQIFEVSECASLEEIQVLHGFFNLEKLSISECPLLKSISNQLMSVRELSISHCPLLKVIPRLNGVVELNISSVESLEEIQGLHELTNLKRLSIRKCPLLKAIPPLSGAVQQCGALKEIQIWECGSLEEILALTGLINLKCLYIINCPRLKAVLLDLRGAVWLQIIKFEFCESLEEIPTLHGLINLRKLYLRYCPRLKAIPRMRGVRHFHVKSLSPL